MTNEKAKQVLSNYLDFMAFVLYPDETFYEALKVAVAALDNSGSVKVEVIEHHTFAKPDDVSDLDFPGVSSEDK